MFAFSLNIYLYVLSRKKDVASLFCFQSKQGFFSSFEPAWATYQWIQTVSFLVSLSPRYSNISNLCAVWYCAESRDFSVAFLKGQSNEIFYVFFHNSSLRWPLSYGFKYFRYLYRFRPVIRVLRDGLRAVWYSADRRVNGHFLKLLHRL